MRRKQSDWNGVSDGMILTVSIFFPLLRLIIYFLLQSGGIWVENHIMPLLQYKEAFDFCSFVFFLISIYIFVCKIKRNTNMLFASVLLNFLNTIVCWDYAPGLWLKAQEVCSWLVLKLYTSEGYVVGFGILIFTVIVVFCWRKWDEEILKIVKKLWDFSKKDGSCIYWIILLILGSFFLVQVVVGIGYSVGFKVTKIQRMAGRSFGVLAIVSAVSMVYICIQVIRKKKGGQTGSHPIIFLDACLSLWGMASIRFYNGKLVMSGKAFRNLLLAEAEMFIAFMVIVAGVIIWKWAAKYLSSDKGIKIFAQKDRRLQIVICISGLAILFVFIAFIIVFVKWGEQINSYFGRLGDQAESFKGIMGLWSMIIIFAVVGIIVLGGISLFIYEFFQAVLKKDKKPSEWIVLLLSFVMTGVSIYIYYQIEPKGKMNEIAEDVAGVFAFPVVLMSWYVIMTGLLASISGLLKDPSEIKNKLAEEMEKLILDSIKAIFAPLSFSADYLATLRDAVMEDSAVNGRGGNKKTWKCCRRCYIWLKKCLKKGGFRR